MDEHEEHWDRILDTNLKGLFFCAQKVGRVMVSQGQFVEIQGTAEGKPFSKETADALLALAQQGIAKLFKIQKQTLRALP